VLTTGVFEPPKRPFTKSAILVNLDNDAQALVDGSLRTDEEEGDFVRSYTDKSTSIYHLPQLINMACSSTNCCEQGYFVFHTEPHAPPHPSGRVLFNCITPRLRY
jgi:hypothetical protein